MTEETMTEDNFDRGDRAEKALAAVGYGHAAETKGITISTPDGESVPGPEGYPISDLIADLGHYSARCGFEFSELVNAGIEHFGCDCVEQAFAADEDWGEELQSAENADRVRHILRVNGVPEERWVDCFVKLGVPYE